MKQKKNFVIFALLIVTCGIYSCKKTVYNQLNEDEIKWLIYMKGDQLIFSNSGTLKDTVFVYSRDRGYVRDKPYYNEGASVNFAKQIDTIGGVKVGSVQLKKDNDNNFSVTISFPHFPQSVELTKLVPLAIDTINGLPFTNVYVIEAQALTTSANNYFNKIYYSRESGFVKLEDIYNRIWYKTN